MRRLRLAAVILLALLVLMVIASLWYVRPTEVLDLDYRKLDVAGKLIQMAVAKKLELTISEAEAGDLVKRALAAKPDIRPGVMVTGARVSLYEGQATVRTSLRLWSWLDVGADALMTVEWEAPDLVVRHTGTRIGRFSVPTSWFQLSELRIPVARSLPKHVTVRRVSFSGSDILIGLGLVW